MIGELMPKALKNGELIELVDTMMSPYEKYTKLSPQCILADVKHDQQVCLNAAGYFTPCCWFDAEDALGEDERIAKFFDPSLNIKNHEKAEDIIEGEYWQEFFKMLLRRPNDAPHRCWRHCGSSHITQKKIKDEDDGSQTRIQI
jgi:hypothetical protein